MKTKYHFSIFLIALFAGLTGFATDVAAKKKTNFSYPKELTSGPNKSEKEVKLSCNKEFRINIVQHPRWITLEGITSEYYGKTHKFSVLFEENTGTERTGTITLKTSEGNVDLKVTQRACKLTLTPNKVTVDASGQYVSAKLSSNNNEYFMCLGKNYIFHNYHSPWINSVFVPIPDREILSGEFRFRIDLNTGPARTGYYTIHTNVGNVTLEVTQKSGELIITPNELTVDANRSEHKVTIGCGRRFSVISWAGMDDWVSVKAPKYNEDGSKTCTISVHENTGNERTGLLIFNTNVGAVQLRLTQKGKDAKPEEPKLTDKTLSVTGKTDHSVSLRWNAATCGSLPHSEIAYSIRYRPKNKFIWRWRRSANLYGKTEHTVTGLEADTEYKFRVLVFRKSMPATSMPTTNVYTDIAEARTDKPADDTPPAFPEGAQVKVDEVTETTVKISWPKAKDDQTPQNEIQYAIYKNGKYDYHATDIDSRTYTLLTQDTKYNFGVYAIDKAGNWSKPLETSVTTEKKVVPDTEPPYFPNGQELSVTATETSLDVSWPAAADKGTETPDLSYTFFFSRSDVSYWPGNSLGKNVLSHTVTGLQPDTEYNICVTVYDAAANSADYTWKMKVKTKASNQTVHPASVSIAPASLDLETGNKATLTATVLPANAKDKGVTWSSNLPAIASVDAVTGEVTALAVGKAEITATANDKAGGTKSETVEVRVKAKKVRKLVTDVSVMPAAHTLTEGDIFYYTGIVKPDDADNKALTWTSSDPTVATVSKGGGFINALKAGTTTITATADDGSGKYGQSILTVKAPGGMVGATGIVVYQTEIQLPKNGTATLTARVLPSNATNKGFTWSSSNPAVASVSSDGVVTAHLPGGTALITATADDGGWTDFCTIHVEGTSVTLSPSAFILEVGESIELTATTEPWNSPMTKSFSSNRFRVAEVDKNGVVKAKAVGDATITVTLSGGQQANCYITVKKGENAPDANELIVDDSNARVWAADGILYVSTEQATDVEVINFSGLLLKKFKAPTGTTPVKYLPAGFYVVRVGQQTTKVVIR